jgi:hypothetical protein
VVDGGQVVAGEVQLHRELGEILKCQASPGWRDDFVKNHTKCSRYFFSEKST